MNRVQEEKKKMNEKHNAEKELDVRKHRGKYFPCMQELKQL